MKAACLSFTDQHCDVDFLTFCLLLSTMSQLLQTVKFKQISTELTDDEFDVFLRCLHRRKGKELMLQILCQQQHAFLDPTEMLQISSNIIQKRKNQQQRTNQWTLDTLPKSFIGEIASNLSQKDYASFSRVNRTICIGCNDPNQLLSLSTPDPIQCDGSNFDITLTKYPQLMNLEMELRNHRDYVLFPNDDSPVCKKLQSLKLFHDEAEGDDAVNTFLQQQSITGNTFPNLQYLLLGGFHDIGNAQTFERIFSKFNTIEHLELTEVYQSDAFNVLDCEEILKKSLPNLTALTLQSVGTDKLGNAILKYRGSGLIRLQLNKFQLAPPLSLDELKEIDFSKLQKLSIGNVHNNVVCAIFKTARNLDAVHWVIEGRDLRELTPEGIEMTQRNVGGLVKMMNNCCSSLTHMHFEIAYSAGDWLLENVCKTIEVALHRTRSRFRNLLCIGVECEDKRMELSESNLLDSNIYFHRILNKITGSNTREYVLFWKMCDLMIGGDCCSDTGDGMCSDCRGKMNKRDLAVEDAVGLVHNTRNATVVRTGDSLYIIKSKKGTTNSYEKWWNTGKWNNERVIY